jgi:hypothetical protein
LITPISAPFFFSFDAFCVDTVGPWMPAQWSEGVTLLKDVARWAANHAKNERQYTQK